MQDALFSGIGSAIGGRQNRPIYGIVIGIVTDNNNPDGDYRVRVKFPTLPGEGGSQDQSWWCRIATDGAGTNGSGNFFLPEVESEVLVAFLHGDFNQPIVIGTLWNGIDKPAYSNVDGTSKTTRYQSNDAKFKGKSDAKKNDLRSISTRQKHELLFNDNASDPMVTLASGQKHRIVLNDKGNEPTQIEIYDGKEENYILIDTKNKKITIETKTGDILFKAKKTIRLEAEKIETDSIKETTMKVGSNFEMKATSNMTLKASGAGNVESSGAMTVKGSQVNIN